jgi:hypothetical protein
MITRVPRVTSVLIIAALIMAVFGGAGLYAGYRRGERSGLLSFLLGLPGVFLGLAGAVAQQRWLYLPATLLVAASYMVQAIRVRHAQPGGAAARTDRLTGVELESRPSALAGQPRGGVRRWSGGANVPGSRGRVEAVMPLACLRLDGSTVSINLRPRLLQKLFGVRALNVTPAVGAEIIPARNPTGIEIRLPHGEWYFFATSAREDVLATLAGAGLAVSWLERQASL